LGTTLQTVADAVGVSRSTVSNAYSRPDQLSPQLREKILEAARRLGYPGPNPTARSLRRGTVGAIGVLFTAALPYAFADPYAVRLLRGLASAAEPRGTGLLLLPLPDDEETAAGVVRDAVVDGFCVYCVPDRHPAMQALRSRALPVVRTEHHADSGPQSLCVGIDEAAATRAAGRHVAQLGHRRIALIVTSFNPDRADRPRPVVRPEDEPYDVTRERLRGFREAFSDAGIEWSDVTIVNAVENSREAGVAAAAYALDQAPRVTAVLAISDVLALGVLEALQARGLRPGHDVSVVGFDDIPEAGTAQLTTVRQPAIEKGRIAGRLLFDPPAEPARRQVLLPTELVVRASTGPSSTRRI